MIAKPQLILCFNSFAGELKKETCGIICLRLNMVGLKPLATDCQKFLLLLVTTLDVHALSLVPNHPLHCADSLVPGTSCGSGSTV